MKILVTGGTGFIGSHLVERLVKEGHEITVLVKKQSENSKREECLNILEKLKVKICYGDILNKESIIDAVQDIDAVFHLAAIARPMAIPREMYFDVNVTGTKNLLEACKNIGLKKIIYMSSISVVGPTRDGNPVNEQNPRLPVDVYGESKLAAEEIVFEYINVHEMPIIILRPSMVYGPRDFELLKLFKMVNTGLFPIKGSNGYMEFLYVENLVDACILALMKGRVGEIYHINDGVSYRMHEVISSIAKAEKVKLLPVKLPNWSICMAGVFMESLGRFFRFHPPFSKDTIRWMTESYWYVDSSKAKRELGYTTKINLEEGVKRTVRYYTGYFGEI